MGRITVQELNNSNFFQTPKALLSGKFKKQLKAVDILVYTVIRDTLQLSKKNNWVNEKNELYVKLKRDTIAEMVGVSVRTVITIMQRLANAGLVEEKRVGLNKANEIYLLAVEEMTKKVETVVNTEVEAEPNVTENNILISGCANIACQEVKKMHTNYTNINKTNYDIRDKNNNNIQSRKEKEEKNVVVDSIVEKFKKKTGAELIKRNVYDLLRDKTEGQIMHYLDNIDAFGERRNIAGTFYLAVKNSWPLPKSYKPVPLHKNYEQRQYDKDYFESLYKEL